MPICIRCGREVENHEATQWKMLVVSDRSVGGHHGSFTNSNGINSLNAVNFGTPDGHQRHAGLCEQCILNEET